ncbi:MAG TPA: hypothetical protein PLD88_00510, partial [Candidatus Berkiella sp.]|nr:hypothetical protein [Candidatus Berkiella sp.]
IEYKNRRTGEVEHLAVADIVKIVQERIKI